MAPTLGVPWGWLRRAWIGFCSGWWLAAVLLKLAGVPRVLTRPSGAQPLLSLESLGFAVSPPGALPFYLAADAAGVRLTLPVGVAGVGVGVILAVLVWLSLPIVVYDSRRVWAYREVPDRYAIAAAVPVLASAAGIATLYRRARTAGLSRVRALAGTLATACVAYLVGAALVFALGLATLS